MKFSTFAAALAGLASNAAAIAVSGAAEGFAKGVTGGGSASPVYPKTNAELVSYLGDSSPRVIVLQRTFDFTGTEGTTSATGCAPWGTGSGCQLAINKDNWCKNYQSSAPSVNVKYDNAGQLGITVASKKTLLGQGSAGIIKGKGLRIVSGANNIIIQNVHITNLNPHYVWGGDAITLDGADMVWIDHVKTSLIGRQHIVLGNSASQRVTISNSEIDGSSTWSATCDNHHYWALYFTGSSDLVTLKGNYIHHTSGRSPKVGGNTLLHAVNNYWYANSGHAFEVGSGASIVAEGNVFQNVASPIDSGTTGGQIFTAPSPSANAVCSSTLGHTCQVNAFGSSGSFNSIGNTNFLSNFKGKNVASAAPASGVVASVGKNAGYGKI
ncbi:Pectin lyase B [Cladosporium halotolerans]|uniref:pectin lyase n=1 Tax=Cladosporium halotolerans TaxID=1052096 RepID=A0AB34KQJ7_9PEZI